MDKRHEEILEQVYARGRKLRLRRRITHVVSVSLSLSLFGGGIVYALNAAPESKQAAPAHEPEIDATAEPKPEPKKTDKPKPAETPKPKPVSKESSKPKPPEPKPEPELQCFNSTNPDCGPFSWKVKPYNSHMSLNVAGPSSLTTGEKGTWTITASDADAKIVRDFYKIYWGDDSYTTPYGRMTMPGGGGTASPWDCVKGYGLWALPNKTSDSFGLTASHTFTAAGTYTLKFKFFSRDNRSVDGKHLCQQAYGDDKYIELVVAVSDPAPDPSPSPTP